MALKSIINYNGVDLFNPPLSKRKVRNGIYAYKYNTGVINICGEKYIGYSMTEAIKLFRKKYPAHV